MGPVSFQRLGADLDRDDLLAAARRLTEAGIGVHSVDPGYGLLVRAEDEATAAALLTVPPDHR